MLKMFENVCFYWYLICKTRYSKMVKNKDMQFFMENLKMNKKGTKNFLTFRRGNSNPRFSVISRPWFEFSCEVRSPRSHQNKVLKEIGLYLFLFRLLPWIFIVQQNVYFQQKHNWSISYQLAVLCNQNRPSCIFSPSLAICALCYYTYSYKLLVPNKRWLGYLWKKVFFP